VRVAFQQEMRKDLIAGIESIPGRKVLAFLSADHIDPDIAIESFILEDESASRSQDGPPRSGSPQ
jgi:hypothetical protein